MTPDRLIDNRIEVLRNRIKKDLIELMRLQGVGTIKFSLELMPEDKNHE